MSELHLSSDDRNNIQTHFDELYRRMLSVILLVVILTGIWSLSIDKILHYVLMNLDPCKEVCVNIFSPDEWAGTRWLSAALLGMFTAAPYAMIQSYSFAQPGLLPSERRVFVIWMIIIWVIAIISLTLTITEFLPWLYAYGHSFNEGSGLVGRYDAVEILRISISIAWAIILVLASMSIVVIAGASNLLWSGNASWWRLRIHGMMLMLLWLVIPNGLPGLLVTLTFMASGMVELAGWRSFRGKMPTAHGLMELLDNEGGKFRVLYVNCSCCGIVPDISPLKGMGKVSYNAVCRYQEEQDNLLDVIMRFGVDKVVFSGCVIDSMPIEFIDSIRFLGCSSQTLDLAHLSTIRTDGSEIDLDLAMASIVHPWSEIAMLARVKDIIFKSEIDCIYFDESIPFGLNLQPNEAWITNPPDSLIENMSKSGFAMKPYSN